MEGVKNPAGRVPARREVEVAAMQSYELDPRSCEWDPGEGHEGRWESEPEVWDSAEEPEGHGEDEHRGQRLGEDLDEQADEQADEEVDEQVDDLDEACGAVDWSHNSVLGAAEHAFRLLTTGPDPLGVDGAALGHGLPARLIPLDELRRILLSADTGYPAREAAWAQLVRLAQSEGAAWVVGAVGVAMPGLRSVAGQLALGYGGDVRDLDAEVLDGFCVTLKTIDPGATMLWARLVWAAQRAGARLRRTEWDVSGRHEPWTEWREPPHPVRHPDLLLAEAVAEGVLSAVEAGVIATNRIEGYLLPQIADALGWPHRRLWHLREEAEARLVAWLTDTTPDEITQKSWNETCKKRARIAL